MRIARHYRIRGRVQAVGFRLFAQDVAAREGLTGYVCNLPDGAVEAVAEGEAEAVERFERQIRQGPRGARVEAVETESLTPGHGFPGFQVRG